MSPAPTSQPPASSSPHPLPAVAQIPTLPPDILTTILSHLLPPTPPLPPHLLSQPLVDRLTFLPPGDDEIDAHLTPFPCSSSTANPIASQLDSLSATGYDVGPTMYAVLDDESVLAKVPIFPQLQQSQSQPQHSPPTSDNKMTSKGGAGGADVLFVHPTVPPSPKPSLPTTLPYPSSPPEPAASSTWTYHSTTLTPHALASLEWKLSPSDLPTHIEHLPSGSSYYQAQPEGAVVDITQTPPSGAGGGGGYAAPQDSAGLAPEGYWDGWTPPTPMAALPDVGEDAADKEDDYWSRYENQQAGPSATPPPPPPPNPLSPSLLGSLTLAPKPPPASSTSPPKLSPSSGKDDSLLRQKLEATVRTSLLRAWADYSSTATHRDEREEKALGWLRIGRGVVDAGIAREVGWEVGGVEDEVVRAKMEVLRDMWRVLSSSSWEQGGGQEDGAGFWRLIEESIRERGSPGATNCAEIEEEEARYWE